MPGERLFVALGLVSLLLPASFLLPALGWVALGLDALLVGAFLADLARSRRAALEASRSWPPLLVQGTRAKVVVEVANRASRAVAVRLREGLHPALAEVPERNEAVLPAGGALSWELELVPRRRGEHRLGPLSARLRGPWGLAWSQRVLLPPEPVRVYPQVRWEGRVGDLLALAQRHRLGQSPLRLQGQGNEPYALREYLAGDPLAKIHWKATARFGTLVSREDTWERGARLLILLDGARGMASLDAGRSKLDHALAAALALARVAAARGDLVSILAFSDRIERTARVRGSGRGLAAAYAALYDLEARLVEPAYDLAVEAALALESRGGTAVLLTSVVDLATAEVLRGALLSLERRHRTLLVHLEDPEIAALAAGEPATPAAAFAQVAALEVLLGNRRLARRLRRAGIRAVTTPSDRLALETLEAYLALFRGRGRAVVGRGVRAVG